jgi:hypothetical protein
MILDKVPANALLLLSREPGNALRLHVDGFASQTLNLEVTDTLRPPQWRVIGTLKPGTSNILEFTDKIELTTSGRFYRVSKP